MKNSNILSPVKDFRILETEQHNFQIRTAKGVWDDYKAISRMCTWEYAVKLAKRTTKLYKSEVRLTATVHDYRYANGHYFAPHSV